MVGFWPTAALAALSIAPCPISRQWERRPRRAYTPGEFNDEVSALRETRVLSVYGTLGDSGSPIPVAWLERTQRLRKIAEASVASRI